MYFKHGRYISKRECKSQKTKIPNIHKMLYESKKKKYQKQNWKHYDKLENILIPV